MRQENVLMAGAGRADITPELGTQLAGDIGRYRPAEKIIDRIYVNAIVISDGKEKFCWLSADLLSSNNEWAWKLRHALAREFGFIPEKVMFHVVQNHGTPSFGKIFTENKKNKMPPEYPWLDYGEDKKYNNKFIQQCIKAVRSAVNSMEPVSLYAGRGVDGRVAFNRRFIMRDGTAKTHPSKCDPNILFSEGPIDPEVGVALFVNRKDEIKAALLHHTCHPCDAYPYRHVVADWPGAWCELMRRKAGEKCVPLVINGCCGNIHFCNHLSPDKDMNYKVMAEKLMETTNKIMGRMVEIKNSACSFAREVLPLPLRKLSARVIADAEKMLEKYPEPKWRDETKTSVDWDWVYAVTILDLAETQKRTMRQDYEIQAFRIGEFALLGLKGEPFVEAQLAIKQRSPASYTFVAHFCNGYAGYLPTRKAFAAGGYETRTGSASRWDKSALEQVEKVSIGLLQKLWK